MLGVDAGDAMSKKESNTTTGDITIKQTQIERFRVWCGRLLETCVWLVSLGFLGAALALAGGGVFSWMLFGSEAIFAFGLLGAAILGGIGGVLLVRNLESAAGRLVRR